MEQKSLGNDMSLTLKLQNPLTEEQLDSLLDVDFDHTDEVYFRTKHGKEVTFVKKQPNNGWISVKDHPPEKDEDVIIYGKYIGSSGAVYPEMLITDIGEFVCNGYVPIAWMPLPEPPKEGEMG